MTSTPITQTEIARQAVNERLSVREKIGYGLGDAGGTVITCLIMNFLTFFYTARCLSPCAFSTPYPTR